MVFAAQKLRLQNELHAPTVVIVDDRIDLEDQITGDFTRADIPNIESAKTKDELVAFFKQDQRKILITTIFKFGDVDSVLNERDNIILLVDEAHRTQEKDLGQKMRNALPNAFFFGLTGTPINKRDKNTFQSFGADEDLEKGGYISKYTFQNSVEDGATLELNFQTVPVEMHLNETQLQEEFDELTDQISEDEKNELVKRTSVEAFFTAEKRINDVARYIVNHFKEYVEPSGMKAQVVVYNRDCCVKYKKTIDALLGTEDATTIVMHTAGDKADEYKTYRRDREQERKLLDQFRDPLSPIKMVIVTSKLLTGFDAPILQCMYLDKPMKGHTLMQAIARVNRVFKDKEGGLIVDYVGIASALKAAMKEYTKRDQSRYGDMDISKVAYPKFQEKLQVCKDLLHGFDFSSFIDGSPLVMAKLVTGGVNFVLDAKAPKRKDLFLREAMLLKQSHSLCSSMTTEQERHEAAYMEAVRSTVVKITYGGSGGKTLSLKEINTQINELLKASIQSQGVISLFDSKQADENISLFDPAVLDEISKMKEKNIAVEILKKLMAEQVSLYKRTNVVQSQKFSEKIAQLMNSYYNGLITNEEVIKELLKTAQEITELYNNGKKLGLTQKELAFYDALTKPENIKDFYQNNELIDLTRELTEMLRKNRTIDWQKKETARASMRKMVKHLLKKYKYPPEDYDTAISTVISQCEMWTDNMTA